MGTENPWQAQVVEGLRAAGLKIGGYTDAGQNGASVMDFGGAPDYEIDTKLASIGTLAGYPSWVLCNYGINDSDWPGLTQAGFEAAYAYIVDAIHARWPYATVYLTIPWGNGSDVWSDTVAVWIGNVIAARSTFCAAGSDERAWFKPNVAAYSTDGLHWNATTAGNAAGAAANLTSMGY